MIKYANKNNQNQKSRFRYWISRVMYNLIIFLRIFLYIIACIVIIVIKVLVAENSDDRPEKQYHIEHSVEVPFVSDSVMVPSKIDMTHVHDLQRNVELSKQIQQNKEKREREKEIEQKAAESGQGLNGVYKVGYYYSRDGKEGVVCKTTHGGKHGLIIKSVASVSSSAEAIEICSSFGEGWHIITLDEHKQIDDNIYKINQMLELKNLSQIPKNGNLVDVGSIDVKPYYDQRYGRTIYHPDYPEGAFSTISLYGHCDRLRLLAVAEF